MIRKDFFSIVILFVICSIFASAVFAQEKPEKKRPESPPLPLPGQTKTDTTAQQTQKERLELPDVLIFGKDTAIRKAETKFIPQNPTTVVPDFSQVVPRSLPEPQYSSPEQTPKFQTTELNSSTRIDLRFGTYNTPVIEVNHWQIGDTYKVNFDSNYERSDGQYENSQYQRWRAALFTEFDLNQNHALQVGGQYRSNEYGLWASPDYERKWNQIIWQFGLKGKFSPQFNYLLHFEQSQTPIRDEIDVLPDTSGIKTKKDKNRSILLNLTYSGQNWGFDLKGNVLLNQVQEPVLSETTNQPLGIYNGLNHSLSAVEISGKRFIGTQGYIKFGVRYEFYSLEKPNQNDNRVDPVLDVNWNLSPKWRIFASYQPQWKLITRRSMLELNPFFNLNRDYFPIEDHRIALEAGTEWKIVANNVIRASYHYHSVKNYLMWESGSVVVPEFDNTRQAFLFHLSELPEVRLSYLKVDFISHSFSPFQLRSSLTFSNSGINELGSRYANVVKKDIPYIEDVSLMSELSYQFQQNWTTIVTAYYFGSKELSLLSPEQGKSIWFLNARLTYQVKQIQFYLLGQNLLDQKFEIWQNYPVTGAQFFVGMEAIF